MKKGDIIEAKSGTQGWVKGEVVDIVDIYLRVPSKIPSILTQGQQGVMVKFLEGKHSGEIIKLPNNYVRIVKSAPASSNAVMKAKELGGIKLLRLAKLHSVDTSGSDAALTQRLIDKGII